MTREEAWKLVNEYVKSPRLLNHLLAVEACMRYFAELYGEDPETWGVIGLLHDFDYERYPNSPDHPLQGERILAELGVPEDIRHTICSHADAVADRYPRRSLRDKVLYAVDELSGLVVATALVRPSKSIHDVDVRAVRKKMKDKRFAAGVDRECVLRGVQELGVDLDEHIGHVIAALQRAAEPLGLAGTAPEGR